MKANAPENIYIQPNIGGRELIKTWFPIKIDQESIEYTRTDAFIEKAWNWVEDNILSSNQQDKSRLYFEQFKNYIKGE